MPNNDVESKNEAAGKSVVDGLSLTGVTSNTGQDDDMLALPNVICGCDQGDEEPLGTGIFRTVLRVTVNSPNNVDDALATHRTRVQTVRDAFMSDAIETTLTTAVSDFHAYIPYARRSGKLAKEEAFCDWLELEYLSCASDL